MSNFLALKRRLPYLGTGLGLRRDLFEATLADSGSIDWLEIVPENYMGIGGKARGMLDAAASRFPIISHGVNLSIGSTDPLNTDYLGSLKSLLERLNAPWWSDHLCFTGANGIYVHDLLPLPFTKEAIDHVVARVRRVTDYIDRPLLLENISCYMRFPNDEMTEAQFLGEVLERADCGLLLDVNNIYVNSVNFGFDPFEYIDSIPLERTVQVHIAGHKRRDHLIIDTHGEPVVDAVYDLLAYVLRKTDVKAVLLERDQNFPCFSDVITELERIRSMMPSHTRLPARHRDAVESRPCY